MVDGGRREDKKEHTERERERERERDGALCGAASWSGRAAPMQAGRTARRGGNVFRVWLNFTERWMGRV